MPKETDVSAVLDAFDARLSSVDPKMPGRIPLPPGLYHFVLNSFRVGLTTRVGANGHPKPTHYCQFVFEVLSGEGTGEELKGRQHTEFNWIDPTDENALATFKGRCEQYGIPEEIRSAKKLNQALEDPREFVRKYGPLPAVEAKISHGKKPKKDGSVSENFGFIRRIERKEIGLFDVEGDEKGGQPEKPNNQPLPPEDPVEESTVSAQTTAFPTDGEVASMSSEDCRVFLEWVGLSAGAVAAAPDKDIWRDATGIIVACQTGADPVWTKPAVSLILAGLNLGTPKSPQFAIVQAVVKRLQTLGIS